MLRIFLACLWTCAAFAHAETPTHNSTTDPFASPRWSIMHTQYLQEQKVRFDNHKVKVFAPEYAEDSLHVPVFFKVEGLGKIEEIVVFADFNPLPLVLKFYPESIQPHLAFRIKLQQSSPIRVAARTEDQVWHVGSAWIDASGGGCTLPSTGSASGDWFSELGEVHAKLWKRKPAQGNRLRMKILHPMDTGLASGIPKFHIETLELHDVNATDALVIGRLELFEPISENPTLSFDIGTYQHVALQGRDNNGNEIQADIQ